MKMRDFYVLFLRKAHNTEHPSRGCPQLVLISQLSRLCNADKVSCSRKQHTAAGVRTVYLCIQNRHSSQPTNMVGHILGGCLFESVLTIWCSSLQEDARAVPYFKMPELFFQCKTYI